jgi:Asp-tRNA(Asn)/Glu-tRNA(Gln) amidotransferase A subunit family amidase
MTAPRELTMSEASARIAAGSLTSEDLVRSFLERIAARDAEVKAWSWLDPDMVIRTARELDKQPRRGPLHGIPVAIKDMIDTRDMPTQHNSPIYAGHRPGQDAACVAILRAAGAIIFGKTDTHEFAAAGRLPATRNPHDLTRTPGGSSSGSAAAVADFQVGFALGTQTGGSTIRPASFCGVHAIKPTWGLLNREGAKIYSITLDTIGWYGRSVSDLVMLAKAYNITNEVPEPPPIRGLKIAVYKTPYWKSAQDETGVALQTAADRLASKGATVSEITLDPAFDRTNEYQNWIGRGEGRAAFLADYRANHALLHQDFRDRVEDKDGVFPEKYRDGLDGIAALRPAFDAAARGYDALLCPAAVGEAPQSLKTTGDAVFNRMWTGLHAPCVALPWHRGPNGMPVGFQLVGPRYSDGRLLAVAETVSRALSG